MFGGHCRHLVILLHYFIVFQQSRRIVGFTIDNRFTVIANDCYTRVSIGSKINDASIWSRMKVDSVSECEEHCSRNGNACNAFTFGVDVKGNGSCAISAQIPDTEKGFQSHPDSDVYLKNRQASPWCSPLDTSGASFPKGDLTFGTSSKTGRKNRTKWPTSPFLNSMTSRAHLIPRGEATTSDGGSIDDQRRLADILANKHRNGRPDERDPFERQLNFANAERYHDSKWNWMEDAFDEERKEYLKNVVPVPTHRPFDPSVTFSARYANSPRGSTFDRLFLINNWKGQTITRPTKNSNAARNRFANKSNMYHFFQDFESGNSYVETDHQASKTFKNMLRPWPSTVVLAALMSRYVTHGSMVPLTTISRTVDNHDNCPFSACYRKLHPGKKTNEIHVGRIVQCANIRECRRTCDREASFFCEGFNYRQTSDAEGSCELTSTPYSRMNVRTDFLADPRCDYYRRNRNCFPETWRSASSGSRWNAESRLPESTMHGSYGQWPPNREQTPIMSYLNQPSRETYPRFDGFPYDTPYEKPVAGSSDGNFRTMYGMPFSGRRNDHGYYPLKGPDVSYGTYGRSHGYPNRNNYDYNPDGLKPKPRPESASPRETIHFYGKFYNYGGMFDYGQDPTITNKKDPAYKIENASDGLVDSACTVRLAAGSRHARRVVRTSRLVRDLHECEEFCMEDRSFLCASFTYRYGMLATDPTDNCLLSDLSYQYLNFYTDLEPDRDYDVYAVISNRSDRICRLQHPSDECFARVRSGFGIPKEITRKSIRVNDLGECQIACTTSEFLCRSFAFKYPTKNSESSPPVANCYLTDWPTREISPENMLDADDAELYERAGCELYPYPVSNQVPTSDRACYSGSEYKRCRLTPQAVMSSTRVDSEDACRRRCSAMRNLDPSPCMSFSYKIAGDGTRDNCLLSDVTMRDLRPNLDYTEEDGHVLYAWRDRDPHCSLSKPSENLEDQLLGGLSFSHEPRYPLHDIGNEERDYSKQPPLDPDQGPFVQGGFQRGFGFFYPKELSTFQRYTVNGYPCKNGTVCQQNEITGFWTCETEGGEYGSWDYCCEPNHRCGFSHGYSYPWCYVGSSEDQWRPCSETYYPYYYTTDRSEYRGSARHWPIIYLHEKSPPNCTDYLYANNDRNLRSNSVG